MAGIQKMGVVGIISLPKGSVDRVFRRFNRRTGKFSTTIKFRVCTDSMMGLSQEDSLVSSYLTTLNPAGCPRTLLAHPKRTYERRALL